MNIITIAGNVGKDAALRHTQKGEAVLGFSVADSRKLPGGEQHTVWFECSVWGKRAEALAPYLAKGTPVTVVGTFTPREYVDKGGAARISYDVRVQEVAMHGKPKSEAKVEARSEAPQDKAAAWKAGATGFDDEDLPF